NPMTSTTNADGEYLFTGLPAGDYYTQIAGEFFQAGGILARKISSTYPTLDTAPDPDADEADLDDNGYPVSGDAYSEGPVRSMVFTLVADTEPDADRDSPSGQSQDFSNLTVDFLMF